MDFGYVGEQLTFLTRSREFLIGLMLFVIFFYSACNTSPIWFPASDWLPIVFRNCRGKCQVKQAWNRSNSNCFCFFYQWWKIKLFWRKQAWIFGKEWNPIDFHSHVHKKHLSNLGRRNDSARAKKFKTWGHVESLRLRWGRKLNSDLCNLFICCLYTITVLKAKKRSGCWQQGFFAMCS